MLGEYDHAAEEFSKAAGSDFGKAVTSAMALARCLMAAGYELSDPLYQLGGTLRSVHLSPIAISRWFARLH